MGENLASTKGAPGASKEKKPLVVMKFGGTSVGNAERMDSVAALVRTGKDPHLTDKAQAAG